MTAALDLPRTRPLPVTLPRVIGSEWLKFRTLRSTLAVLGAAMLGMLVIALVVAFNTRQLTPNLQANDLSPSATMQGYYLGQLLIGALGVLFVTGEYSTGMIRATLVAVPRRTPVLWGKLVVFVSVVLVATTATCLVSFLAAQALLARYRPGYSLADPGVLRVVVGTAVYLTLAGLIGAAYGWIVRSTPGALVAYFGTMVVLPVLFGAVLGNWGKHVAEYLPTQAGAAFSTSVGEPPSLAPWPGLLVMLAWVVLGLAVSATLLRRRDA